MSTLESKVDRRSDSFKQNTSDMMAMLAQLEDLHAEVEAGGGEEAMNRLRSRNKMPVRERIALVLDEDAPFLEISPLA
ncbi:MAG: acyl-CoA carboxylase subunit beta, partial [Pseudomonadales bacterium]